MAIFICVRLLISLVIIPRQKHVAKRNTIKLCYYKARVTKSPLAMLIKTKVSYTVFTNKRTQ